MNFENYKNFVKENDGDEIYLEELILIKGILNCDSEEIMFTNSDESEELYTVHELICKQEHVEREFINFYHKFEVNDFSYVACWHEGGLMVIFIKESEIEKLEQYV